MLDDGLDDAPAVAHDEEAHAAEATQRVQPARDAHGLADVAGDLRRANAGTGNGGNGCLHGNTSLLMMRCAGPAVVEDGKRAVAGHCSLVQARSRRLASPLSSSSIASAPLHVMWTSVHRLVLRLFRAESVSNNAIAVSVAHLRPYKKPPSRLWTRATRRIVVPPLFAPQRASAGPPRYTANRPSRANGRIPGTATEDSPSGSGVSCGRMAAALSALAFRLRVSLREPLSVAPRALAQSPSQPVDSTQCARSITHALRFRWQDRRRATRRLLR